MAHTFPWNAWPDSYVAFNTCRDICFDVWTSVIVMDWSFVMMIVMWMADTSSRKLYRISRRRWINVIVDGQGCRAEMMSTRTLSGQGGRWEKRWVYSKVNTAPTQYSSEWNQIVNCLFVNGAWVGCELSEKLYGLIFMVIFEEWLIYSIFHEYEIVRFRYL